MKKLLFAALLPLLLLAACASAPEVRWAQAQSAYNEAVRQAVAARKPCVDSALKEADPGCLIKAKDYGKVDAAIRAGDRLLRAIEAGGSIGDAAIAAVLDTAAEIVLLIPKK